MDKTVDARSKEKIMLTILFSFIKEINFLVLIFWLIKITAEVINNKVRSDKPNADKNPPAPPRIISKAIKYQPSLRLAIRKAATMLKKKIVKTAFSQVPGWK